MNGEFSIRALKLDGMSVDLHPRARPAYHVISALPQFLPLTKLTAPTFLGVLKHSPLCILASQRDQSSIRVVGGFAAFHVFGALALIGKRPKRLDVRPVDNDPAAITTMVQSKLLAALMRHPSRTDSRALESVIRLLTDENAAAIFGDVRPSRRSVSDATGISVGDLTPSRKLFTGADSDILSNVLGDHR